MKKQKPKTIRICSKEYDLTFDKKEGGSQFGTIGLEKPGKEKGRGKMVIGMKHPDPQYVGQSILHETLEAIFTEDDKRHEQWNSKDRNQYMFVFDHDYLTSLLVPRIFDALRSCDFEKYLKPITHGPKKCTQKRKKI